jgi:hypothetical protein
VTYRVYVRYEAAPADWELKGSAQDRPVADDMADGWKNTASVVEVRLDQTLEYWSR